MTRRFLVVALAAILFVAMMAAPAMAASTYCSVGQSVRIKSNQTTGSQRIHSWHPLGGSWHDQWFGGLGWKYSYTGVEDVDSHYYSADGNVPTYLGYCVNGPS